MWNVRKKMDRLSMCILSCGLWVQRSCSETGPSKFYKKKKNVRCISSSICPFPDRLVNCRAMLICWWCAAAGDAFTSKKPGDGDDKDRTAWMEINARWDFTSVVCRRRRRRNKTSDETSSLSSKVSGTQGPTVARLWMRLLLGQIHYRLVHCLLCSSPFSN